MKYFVLDKELAAKIKEHINDPITISQFHPELFNLLVNEKFIVRDFENEYEICRSFLESRFSNNSLVRLTVNPTLDCNLRCWYCYEEHYKGSCMKTPVMKGVKVYINNIVQDSTVESFQLSFFGGEPLLKFYSVVMPLIEYSYAVCKKAGIKIIVNFTTNGVCLTKRVIDYLNRFDCEKSVQVAFDGDEEEHNKTKFFMNGKGSYEIVKHNIEYALDKGFIVSLRCNYTSKNIDTFATVINEFRKYWNSRNFQFSFHRVWQEKDSNELFRKINKLKKYIVANGIRSNINSFLGDSRVNCYADFDKNVIVNFNGDIFKCTARSFNDNFKIGHLNEDGSINFNENYINRQHARYTKECYTCKLSPICTVCSQLRSESVYSCPSSNSRIMLRLI